VPGGTARISGIVGIGSTGTEPAQLHRSGPPWSGPTLSALTYRARQRISDVLAAIEAIGSHVRRGDLSDGLVFDGAPAQACRRVTVRPVGGGGDADRGAFGDVRGVRAAVEDDEGAGGQGEAVEIAVELGQST